VGRGFGDLTQANKILFSDKVQSLITLIEESTRASQITSKYFIEPAPGVLSRANSRRHHIIFGRRGSGKSSLLNKIHAENLAARTPSVFVDLEKFKGHIYPDLLVSVLIETFASFVEWLENAGVAPATKRKFWEHITSLSPQPRKAVISDAEKLAGKIKEEIRALNELLLQEESVRSEDTFDQRAASNSKNSAGVEANAGNLKGNLKGEEAESREIASQKKRSYETSKHQTLQRNILRYKDIFTEIKSVSSSEVFLIFDDLYHIVRSDQADVIDYFHKIAKGGSFWLKIGTVRHRTSHYRNGNPPVGVKLSDDVDSIDLDVTLEKYATTKRFLFEILDGFAKTHELQVSSILTDGARDRLVLTSGGVARDFLSLFRNSISEARERLNAGKDNRGERVTAEDVNRASGRYYDDKLQELNRDTTNEERLSVEQEIERIRTFCFEKSNANIILVEKDRTGNSRNVIGELVDLKIIHQIRSGVTVSKRQGERFDAFMLDFSFYTGDRTKRKFEVVDFWMPSTRDDVIRKLGFVYDPAE
jgi:hypothetical protein